jgi:hypothetical protein
VRHYHREAYCDNSVPYLAHADLLFLPSAISRFL